MQCIKPTCAATLVHLMPDPIHPPARFVHPSYVAQSGLVACLMLLAAVGVLRANRPHMPVIGVDPARLSALVRLLRESDPIMRIIIDKTEAMYGRTEDVAVIAASVPGLSTGPSFSDATMPMLPTIDLNDMPLDPAAAQLFDLDMMGWDFLMPEWTNGLGQPV